LEKGVLAKSFEVQKRILKSQNHFIIEGDLATISKSFNASKGSASPWLMFQMEVGNLPSWSLFIRYQ